VRSLPSTLGTSNPRPLTGRMSLWPGIGFAGSRLAILLLVLPVLVACSVGYQARGSFGELAEMRGKAYPAMRGGGRFVLADPDGRLVCDGEAAPPSRSPAAGSCAGEAGDGEVRCSDGRKIMVRWEAITCRSWQGSGVDAAGNRLEFRVERVQ